MAAAQIHWHVMDPGEHLRSGVALGKLFGGTTACWVCIRVLQKKKSVFFNSTHEFP